MHNMITAKIPVKIILQRFSVFLPKASSNNNVWIHCVSSGEFNAVIYLVKLFINKGYDVFVSVSTYTGYKTAVKHTNERLQIFYNPIDIYIFYKILIHRIKPKFLMIAELELWPSMINCAYNNNIHLYQINGFIDEISYNKYLKIKNMTKHMLSKFQAIYTQTDEYKQRYIDLGAVRDKVYRMGNTKFDFSLSKGTTKEYNTFRNELKIKDSDFIILFASTHKGEDELLINIYTSLKDRYNNIKIILAPRNPSNKAHIQTLLKKHRFNYTIRSKDESFTNDFFLLDTMGELCQFYATADLVVMGGSFVKGIGGHNILEPAFYSKPVIIGIYHFMIKDIVSIFRKNNALIISDSNDLLNNIDKLVNDDLSRNEIGMNAYTLLKKGSGTSERIFADIMKKEKT